MSLEPRDVIIEDSIDTVLLKATFPGRIASKCDLMVTDLYAKFNLNPYLLFVDFPEKVSTSNVLATANSNTLTVHIKKVVEEKWPDQPWKFEDKEALKVRRQEAFDRLIAQEREREERQRAAKAEEERKARERAWEKDKAEREAVRKALEDDKRRAEEELFGEDSAQDLKSKPLYQEAQVAPTRGSAVVQIAHTPTMKEQPARYDGPQRDYICPAKGDASPYWMKKQGDQFYSHGDYKSAINAYTVAIDGSDRMYCSAFSNRAAARLKLGMYKVALQDCNEALALFHDPIVSHEALMMKLRLMSRRVAALYGDKQYAEAGVACAEIMKYVKGSPFEKVILADFDALCHLAGGIISSGDLTEKPAQIQGNEAIKAISDDMKE